MITYAELSEQEQTLMEECADILKRYYDVNITSDQVFLYVVGNTREDVDTFVEDADGAPSDTNIREMMLITLEGVAKSEDIQEINNFLNMDMISQTQLIAMFADRRNGNLVVDMTEIEIPSISGRIYSPDVVHKVTYRSTVFYSLYNDVMAAMYLTSPFNEDVTSKFPGVTYEHIDSWKIDREKFTNFTFHDDGDEIRVDLIGDKEDSESSAYITLFSINGDMITGGVSYPPFD